MNDTIYPEMHLKPLSPVTVAKEIFGILYNSYSFIPVWAMREMLIKLYALINLINHDLTYDKVKKEENIKNKIEEECEVCL